MKRKNFRNKEKIEIRKRIENALGIGVYDVIIPNCCMHERYCSLYLDYDKQEIDFGTLVQDIEVLLHDIVDNVIVYHIEDY